MLKTDYNIPIFEDTDAADLNKYSNEIANALKTQINNTNNEIKEIDQKVVDAVNKFTEPLSYKGEVTNKTDLPSTATNGDIYNVTSENKNYIWNGSTWVEYSSTLNLTSLEDNTKTTITTDTSESLIITDCAPVNGKLDIASGKSIQEGTPTPTTPIDIRNVGDNINLFDKSKAGTLGYYNSSNTFATSTVYNYFEFTPILNTDYTIKTTNKFSTNVYFVGFDSENNTTLITNFSSNELTFNSSNYVKIGYSVHSEDFNNCKLEEGTKATSYSEYGCGSVGFKVQNKNIIDIEDVTTTINGVTVTKSGDTFTINGTATGTCQFGFENKDVLTLKEQYTLSNTFISGTKSGTANFNVRDRLTDTIVPNSQRNLSTSSGSTTFEVNNQIKYGLYIVSGATFNNYKIKMQLEKGDTATDFIEHQSQKVIFPLSQGQVLHKGDYLAEDGIHQVKGTYVFTGTESWQWIEAQIGACLGNFGAKGFSEVICNCFTNSKTTTWVDKNCGFSGTGSTIWFKDTERFTLLVEWTTYLAEQYANGTPVTVEYELAEEIVIPYTTEQEKAYYELQHLLMYEGYTSIECLDEIKPDIQVTYSYNNEINTSYGKKIDSLEERIRQLEKTLTSLTSEVSE